jgi:predicted DNA-binding transcriptional regulator AlpA
MTVKSDLKSVTSQPCWADTQFVRANQIARSRRTQTPLIDVSLATWWRWVASGRAPKPKRLSPGTTVWDLHEVLEFIKRL